jgi:hypothetical protein
MFNGLTSFLILPFVLAVVILAASFWLTIHRRRDRAIAGTAPLNFPPETVIPVGQIQTGNKTGLTAALATTVFFTAPTAGWYLLAWAIKINSTDAAGTLTATVTPPHSVAIPGIQAAPATSSDGKSPAAPYWMAAGDTVTVAVAVAGLTGTNYDAYLFATRLF